MKKVNNDPDFHVYNWGEEQMNLIDRRIVAEFKPIEAHIKMNGTVDNRASFALVLEDSFGIRFITQLSLEMFQPVIDEMLVKGESNN